MTRERWWAHLQSRARDEAGLTSTVTVLVLFPLTTVLLLAGVQTVLWQHARTLIADRANQTAALVAVDELDPTTADSELTAGLEADPDLANVDITVTRTPTLVTVTVAADAPGILTGTRTRIHTSAAVPTETWQPLP